MGIIKSKEDKRLKKKLKKDIYLRNRKEIKALINHPDIKKKGTKKRKDRKIKRILRDTLLTFILTIIIIFTISSFFFRVERVRGFSMISTLRDGDRVLVQKTTDLKRFDLATFFSQNNSVQIRRIIGFPGEKVLYKKDTLYINDQPLDEKFIVDEVNESQRNGKNYTEDFIVHELASTTIIPEGYYFVLGDNRPYATDSRVYGLVSAENMIGKVTVRILPFTSIKAF